jgi:glutaredoxin 3
MTQQPHAEVFGTTSCRYCDDAKALLTERGIPFTFRNIDEDEDAFSVLLERIGNWLTVPQIFVAGEHVGGFSSLKERLG